MTVAVRVALAGLLLCSACVTGSISRVRINEPVSDDAVLDLRQSAADLTRCLDTLEAPLLVIEQPQGGMALAWGWLDQFEWGIRVSLDIRDLGVSADYDSTATMFEGVVLFFDKANRLTHTERGLLRDLIRPYRRPVLIE